MGKKARKISFVLLVVAVLALVPVLPYFKSYAATNSIMSYCPQDDGTTKSGFSITGNLSSSKGSVTVDGRTLSTCLKIESSTSITFTTTQDATLKLYFNSDFSKKIKIDGTSYSASSGIVTTTISAGSHTIKKGDTANLYYLDIIGSGSSTPTQKPSDEETTETPTEKPTETQPVSSSKVGTITNMMSKSDSSFSSVIYCAPNANGTGSSSSPMSFEKAITTVSAGQVILLKSGTYSYDHQITIAYGNNGSSSAYKAIKACSGANVVFDFSSETYGDTASNDRGIQLEGNYWYIGGIKIKGAADNGMLLAGSNNIIERCVFEANRDSGLQVSRRNSSLSSMSDWPSNNTMLNCTAFNNDDPATHENADGFAAKLTCGNGNVFDGCIAYSNCDDGWDLYAKSETGSIGVVTIKNCLALGNGTLTNGSTTSSGDKNGFKLGGSNGAVPTAHVVNNCMAIKNGKNGFTDNGNGGKLSVSNCTAYANTEANFNFGRTTAGGKFVNLLSANNTASDKFIGTLQNSVYANSKKYYYQSGSVTVASGDKVGTVVSDPSSAMVNTNSISVTSNLDSLLRNSDGTIKMNKSYETNASGQYGSTGAHFGGSAASVKTISVK